MLRGSDSLGNAGPNRGTGREMSAITPESWQRFALCQAHAHAYAQADACVLRCAAVRTAESVESLEPLLGRPVITSNTALAWYCVRQPGMTAPMPGFGHLLHYSDPLWQGSHDVGSGLAAPLRCCPGSARTRRYNGLLRLLDSVEMASQIEHVITELRRRIVNGVLPAGERIIETTFAPELGVSRTPLRLALVELERQGLLERGGKRGYRVRIVTLDEVAKAIDVRGVLEGYGVRLLAETGLTAQVHSMLDDCVAQGRRLLNDAGRGAQKLDTTAWAAMNARFHQTLVESAGNECLRAALEHVTKSPLVGAGALGFSGQPSLELAFIQRAQTDHEDLLAAISNREGARAEALMREHARRSRDNKRALMERIAGAPVPDL